MGQMIKCFYLGAYLEVSSDEFQEKRNEDDFYEEVADKHFLNPYQGLENLNVLLPSVDDYRINLDLEDEFILTKKDFYLEDLSDKFRVDYAEQIAIVDRYFPGSVAVKTGLVVYWDEIA